MFPNVKPRHHELEKFQYLHLKLSFKLLFKYNAVQLRIYKNLTISPSKRHPNTIKL